MGYWENTTYVQLSALDSVRQALIELFESEGMRQTPRPAARERLWYEPMQYDGAFANNLWAVALIPGPEWTAIKTAPLELLGERAAGAAVPRLAALCRRLQCFGFQLNVYDGSGAILLETDASGRINLSGHKPQAADPLRFNSETVPPEKFIAGFQSVTIPAAICAFDARDDLAHSLARFAVGSNAEYCDNLTCVQTLITHAPLAVGSDLYFTWPAGDRPQPASMTLEEFHASRASGPAEQ
jgi:hypothetical protein